MGVQCRIELIAHDAPLLLEDSFAMVHELEGLWSRFLPESDIMRLNHARGVPTRVDPRTVALVAAMKNAFAATNGSFNPTCLPDQIADGDARSLVSPLQTTLPAGARRWDTIDDILITHGDVVSLPDSMTLDAGGIAKGLAADLIAEHVIRHGAEAVCVNLGGDIRVANAASTRHDFAVDVLSPFDPEHTTTTVSLRNGAVATSARAARRRGSAGVENHVQGARSDLASASVIASTAMWAEVWAKHALVSPAGIDDIDALGLAAHTVDTQGRSIFTHNWAGFTRC